MIVADTNLLVYLKIRSDQTPLAERVLDKDSDWHAPPLWRSEFRSALASNLRAGRISYEHALEAMKSAEQMMLHNEHSVDSTDVMRLVADSTSSAYDCEFVALANHLNVPLVTSDSQLLRNFPDRALAPDRFLTA
jgi:predicted nucleic acid-binding protein